MIVDNFNDYHNQSSLLSNIHSFSLWKIYYCYDKKKQQKEKKNWTKILPLWQIWSTKFQSLFLEHDESFLLCVLYRYDYIWFIQMMAVIFHMWHWDREDPRLIDLMSGKVEEKKDTQQHLFSRGSFCPWMKYFLLHAYHEL